MIAAKRKMTEAEFVAWCDPEVRAEWVDGKVVVHAPTETRHSDINAWLLAIMRQFLDHKNLGRVFGPNLTARFANQRCRRLPDVQVLLNSRLRLLRKCHVEGAADFIIEIVDVKSQSRDYREKYHEYEKAGVREYWILDPISERVEINVLKRGRYVEVAPENGIWRSTVLKGFYLDSAWLWRDELPKVMTVSKELRLLA